jgi:hypothetical protein
MERCITFAPPPPPSPKNITFARIKKKAYIAGKIDQLQVKYINKFWSTLLLLDQTWVRICWKIDTKGGNQNPLITDGYNTKYKGQSGKQRSTTHYTENITQKTKDRATRILIKKRGWTHVLRQSKKFLLHMSMWFISPALCHFCEYVTLKDRTILTWSSIRWSNESSQQHEPTGKHKHNGTIRLIFG